MIVGREEDLMTLFQALVSCLEQRLSADQTWELETYAQDDDLDVAFELLCATLRELAQPLPTEARLLLKQVACGLGVDKVHWQDLAPDQPEWGVS
jgi:hypothetical protein